MTALRSSGFLLALALLGCDSQIHMAGTAALAPIAPEAGVPAILGSLGGVQQVTIDNPTLLPEAVRAASDLKVAFGGVKVPVSRTPGGYYVFTIPANARVSSDVAGNLRVVFVMNDTASQILTLKTGSPVQFAQPPVLTDPGPAFLVRGLDVTLKANTDADPNRYQFTWSYGTSAQGPWNPIPGQGKEVEWTPALAGNYLIKVDAVDRQSQQSHSTVTPSAVVFVTDPEDVITTEPTSGSIARGSEVTLQFNRPSGLKGNDFSIAWSAAASLQGPWQVINGSGESVRWLPTNAGSYFIKAEVTNRETGDVNTFVSPQADVFVSEGQPIVQVSQQNVERGDKVSLSLAIADPGPGPFTWYYARTSGTATIPGVSPSWTFIPGNGKTIEHVVNEAGSYNFRVDIPQAGGAVKSFSTTDPVLNVIERVPLIQSEPPNATIVPGGSVALVLNARGVEEGKYKFTYYVSTNPSFGWNALPIDDVDDLYKKRYSWRTSLGGVSVSGQVVPPTSAGSYFVRVDANEISGTKSYTFTSSGPVFTIETTASN